MLIFYPNLSRCTLRHHHENDEIQGSGAGIARQLSMMKAGRTLRHIVNMSFMDWSSIAVGSDAASNLVAIDTNHLNALAKFDTKEGICRGL